ncbi:ImmA/IrrE family metallo-endopeptidase [Marinococcus luteus]|uniref:ImmA/IrrE family metallo-endopeptidase n=1 Tax=Marinococcus luteus TaxID=1122204 RepID=UPI002ACCBA7A|nr:ImmA/IrrE family metallo-endopeptidase [Marinococcus luteus]MDZ5782070.1 ImmA/IrrE family metallo-endopeptidase [Marinococcus luteus]
MYSLTYLEDYVEKLHQGLNHVNAADIHETRIAEELNIEVEYNAPFDASMDRTIFLASDCPKKIRLAFAHELAHVRWDTDEQWALSPSFKQYIEEKANHFSLYFCLPAYMIFEYDLQDPGVLYKLSEEFVVPVEVVRERMRKIWIRERELLNVRAL